MLNMAVRPHGLESLYCAVSRCHCHERGLGRLHYNVRLRTLGLPAVRLSARKSLRGVVVPEESLGRSCKSPLRFFPLKLSLARGVEIAIATIPLLSHGSLTCKACRRVESEGPCVRFSAVFTGGLPRGLVGCRKCRNTVVRRGCGARFRWVLDMEGVV